MAILNDDDNLRAIREEYQNNIQTLNENRKSNSGGMLNSIGSYNLSSSTGQSTFGLGQARVNAISSKNLEKEQKEYTESDSESDEDEDGINTNEILRKHKKNSYENNLMNFDEILSSTNKIESDQNHSSKKLDLLSMNDLFSTSKNSNSNNQSNQQNFVFDFTKK